MKCKKGLTYKVTWEKGFWKNPELIDKEIIEAVKNFKGNENPPVLHSCAGGWFFIDEQKKHTGKNAEILQPLEVFIVTGLQGFYPYKDSPTLIKGGNNA